MLPNSVALFSSTVTYSFVMHLITSFLQPSRPLFYYFLKSTQSTVVWSYRLQEKTICWEGLLFCDLGVEVYAGDKRHETASRRTSWQSNSGSGFCSYKLLQLKPSYSIWCKNQLGKNPDIKFYSESRVELLFVLKISTVFEMKKSCCASFKSSASVWSVLLPTLYPLLRWCHYGVSER